MLRVRIVLLGALCAAALACCSGAASKEGLQRAIRPSLHGKKVIQALRGGSATAEVLRGGRAAVNTAPDQADTYHTVSVAWPIVSAWLYFLACAFAIPALPRIVNSLVGQEGRVTGRSATVYALIASTDALFTFLTTNLHATMSDTYGRKPFMLLSTVGLGLGFTITLLSRRVWPLLLAAAVDGSSSCMYSIAQACVTDCVGRGDKLSEALGLFQGLAIGMAFTIGMPIGGVLAVKKGPRFSVCVSVALCALNALLTGLIMPESLHRARRKPTVDFTMANPVGALRLLSRSPISLGISICYCLHWIANAGLQINFFNYTEKKLSWTPAQSGGGLALMGILVAVAPKLIIPRFGLRRALPLCLTVYAAAQLLIGAAPAGSGTAWVYTGLALSAVGSVAFPTTLALLNQQVGEDEGGAIQGAADTVKTFTTVCANPLMAACFGYFISAKAPKGLMGGSYYVGGGVAALAALVALVTITRYGHLADDEKPAAPAATAVPQPLAAPEPAVELRVEPRQEPRDEAPVAPPAVFAEPLSSELQSTETEQ